MSRAEAKQQAAVLSALGRKLFFDPALSRSSRMSCASCHDPAYAYGPPPNLATANRAVPSLRYLQTIPAFTEHSFDAEDKGADNGPTGGLTWDGRVDRGRDQARIPLFSPGEMANENPEALMIRLRKAGYAVSFKTVLEALETYEQDDREFYPYSSKFDAWMAGKAALTEQERRGLNVFKDPLKGNCSSCHTAERGSNGTLPQLTDYGFAALGVPRNPAIAASADPNYFDMGLCGPLRTDLRGKKEYCGKFMTPSLRNVATRHSFFHNAVFTTLKDAVTFYAERDTTQAGKFDDLPAEYWQNIDKERPFGGSRVLSDKDIDDIVAFLQTLTDGYTAVPGYNSSTQQ
jgi:cytochrome c peroxidase